MAKKKAAAKRPTRADLKRYVELRDKKAEHERDARRCGQELATLKEKFEAYVRAEGATSGKRREVTVVGYLLAIVKRRGIVPWKDVAIAECHPETIKQYEDKVPDREVLEVTKA